MWPFNLSVRLPIVALVGRYLTNQLIGRESILKRINPFPAARCRAVGLCGISSRFQLLSPTPGQVTHALLTRSPLSYFLHSQLSASVLVLLYEPKLFCFLYWANRLPLRLTGKKLGVKKITPFDLHVLGAPPAFVLSQDQTLYKWYLIAI